jgi:GH3 auxin-responsive promoter
MGPATAAFWDRTDVFTTPIKGSEISDEPAARYVHLLFGLRCRDLLRIESTFSSLVYLTFHDLEKHWKELVTDIRQGTLRKDLDIAEDIRQDLEAKLSPDPQRATELQTEFSQGFFESLIQFASVQFNEISGANIGSELN